jgi:putative hemolysin
LKPATPIDAWATPLAAGGWSFDGAIPVNELKNRLGLDELPQEDKGRYNTLAGLLMLIAGRLPIEGEQIECADWTFTINKMNGHRVDLVSAFKRAKKSNN